MSNFQLLLFQGYDQETMRQMAPYLSKMRLDCDNWQQIAFLLPQVQLGRKMLPSVFYNSRLQQNGMITRKNAHCV